MLLNCLAKLGDDSAVQLVVDEMIRVSHILKNDVCCEDFLAIKLKIIIVVIIYFLLIFFGREC